MENLNNKVEECLHLLNGDNIHLVDYCSMCHRVQIRKRDEYEFLCNGHKNIHEILYCKERENIKDTLGKKWIK